MPIKIEVKIRIPERRMRYITLRDAAPVSVAGVEKRRSGVLLPYAGRGTADVGVCNAATVEVVSVPRSVRK